MHEQVKPQSTSPNRRIPTKGKVKDDDSYWCAMIAVNWP
jgi:hypothetical protein